MAFENIKYLYDYIRFYLSAIGSVIIHFFMRLENELKIESLNKKSIKTCEKTLSKL